MHGPHHQHAETLSGLTISLALLFEDSLLRREGVLALRRIRSHNASSANGDTKLWADGTCPVFHMLFQNAIGLFDGWVRTDIVRIRIKETFLEDDTPHHVRRIGHAILVDCFTDCVVAHAGAGDGRSEKSIVEYQVKFWSKCSDS